MKAEGTELTPAAKAEYQKLIDEYEKKVETYKGEQKAIQAEAKRFEEVKADAQLHGQTFGIAVIYLQIAILLSSIAALLKKKVVWLVGTSLGAVGVVYFINGFFMFF
jgi:hypothetical protein